MEPPDGNLISQFQSLFLWKYVSGNRDDMVRDRNHSVSILVFVEVRLRPKKQNTGDIAQPEFQSLFLWKYVSGIAAEIIKTWLLKVSILVFVEVRLR